MLLISRQISRERVAQLRPVTALNSSASMTSGAPSTTSGAPCDGHSIAWRIERPPTACTGIETARTTASSSSIGLSPVTMRRSS